MTLRDSDRQSVTWTAFTILAMFCFKSEKSLWQCFVCGASDTVCVIAPKASAEGACILSKMVTTNRL